MRDLAAVAEQKPVSGTRTAVISSFFSRGMVVKVRATRSVEPVWAGTTKTGMRSGRSCSIDRPREPIMGVPV